MDTKDFDLSILQPYQDEEPNDKKRLILKNVEKDHQEQQVFPH